MSSLVGIGHHSRAVGMVVVIVVIVVVIVDVGMEGHHSRWHGRLFCGVEVFAGIRRWHGSFVDTAKK